MTPRPLAQLQSTLHHDFRDIALLREALTHPSFAAENAAVKAHNQRLEFLGDAVLQLISTDLLFRRFPELPEGELTRLRATFTRRETLAGFARHLQLGDFLALGHGEERNGGRERDSNLCDVFEAVVGAIYLDGSAGMAAAADLIRSLIDEFYPQPRSVLAADNPKGALQEWVQQHGPAKPVYCVEEESGPDHDKTFRVAVYVDGIRLGEGRGGKRQAAEQGAAREALTAVRRRGHGQAPAQ